MPSSESDPECADIISILPISVSKSVLMADCRQRFDQLMLEHAEHQQSVHFKARNMHGRPLFARRRADRKRQAIILDLDETLMDQRSLQSLAHETDADFFRKQNANDLIFNLNHSSRRKEMLKVGVFRKGVMRFIHSTQTQNESYLHYDLLLYSKAGHRTLFFQAITLELYYNYVHALRDGAGAGAHTKSKRVRHKFEFKHVISRFDDLRFKTDFKSLDTLLRLIGSDGLLLNAYHTIIIVDDMAGAVWQSAIPKEFHPYGMVVVAVKPPTFMLSKDKVMLDESVCERVLTKWRDQDRFFALLTKVVHQMYLLTEFDCTRTPALNWMELTDDTLPVVTDISD